MNRMGWGILAGGPKILKLVCIPDLKTLKTLKALKSENRTLKTLKTLKKPVFLGETLKKTILQLQKKY